jgi:hypothetical protein
MSLDRVIKENYNKNGFEHHDYYNAEIYEKRLYTEPCFFGYVETEPGKKIPPNYYNPWCQIDGYYIVFNNFKEEEKRKALFNSLT